jgi:hypothetical protein
MTPDIRIHELKLGDGPQCVIADVFMGKHHPFGPSGRAAGVIQMSDLVFINGNRLKVPGISADDIFITVALS